jgi:hypothetical protein
MAVDYIKAWELYINRAIEKSTTRSTRQSTSLRKELPRNNIKLAKKKEVTAHKRKKIRKEFPSIDALKQSGRAEGVVNDKIWETTMVQEIQRVLPRLDRTKKYESLTPTEGQACCSKISSSTKYRRECIV